MKRLVETIWNAVKTACTPQPERFDEPAPLIAASIIDPHHAAIIQTAAVGDPSHASTSKTVA